MLSNLVNNLALSAGLLRRSVIGATVVSASIVSATGASSTWAAPKTHQTEQAQIQVTELASGLQHPWGLDFLPDGRILVTERPGQLRVYDPEQGLQPPIKGLPAVAVHGQGGLLDVAVHPDFEKNRWVYLSYAAEGKEKGTFGTEVARAKLINGKLQQVETLFVAQPKVDGGAHFGSRLVFDGKGHLFITLGDRGKRDPAQDLSNHIGTVVRLHEDGSVPEDNPFVGSKEARPEIYSYGHRNVQGATLNPFTGELWAHEHGPQGGDEINLPKPGVNYGWPVITYGVNYGSGTKIGEGITEKEGMIQPLYYWDPSIAPSGMLFYNGNKFPEWQGDLLVGSLKFQTLVRLELKDGEVVDEERMLKGEYGRVRDVEQGPDGYVYLVTDAGNGKLLRLEPAKTSK
jgi:glucose/arabinose dehydrogenase